ncbi:hypothetical protein E2562_034938 [Oryza meyeriana var. granulata]|uniref:EamA domain-containing protein n=1 Tax=Oryza meyeriana var. granulata TaxID=110450 RepID=A0A6G1F1N7_9ORYZ|nr:hypothetical protein E2562_034938 [Oryza meyeriana var. granulata]
MWPAAAASLRLLVLPPPPPPSARRHRPAPALALARGGRGVPRLAAAARRETPPSPSDAVDCVGTGTDAECYVDGPGAQPLRREAPADTVDCVGTGTDVECFVDGPGAEPLLARVSEGKEEEEGAGVSAAAALDGREWWEWASLVSPFFFWGTAMVAMKGVIPKTGPFFVAALRLLPAGALLVAFAAARGRKQPSGWAAWIAVAAFGLVDAACFQGFLAEGLQKTSAGLGSVIIDSQPLTVAILAALLFGESIGAIGVGGLMLGVVGLLLLEVPALSVEGNDTAIWGSGEWWMFLSAQSMAVGTIMVRWVSKYSDPIMATGWVSHMIKFFAGSSIWERPPRLYSLVVHF